MKTCFTAKQENKDIPDTCLVKQEMDTKNNIVAHPKPEPHVRHHAIAVKPEQKKDIVQVKTEPSYPDIKMADDSDSDMSDATAASDIVKQEAASLDTKSHQTGIGSASSVRIIVAKQEQPQPATTASSSSSSSPGHRLKSKELARAFEKSGRDYFYQCHLCTELKTTLLDLLNHLSKAHKFYYRSRTFKHLELEPDLKDPNFYCRVCETTYPSIYMFKKHFRLIHYMITRTTRSPPSITPLQAIKTEKEYLLPDRNDPNNYCRTCEKSYVSQYRYFSHLAKFHDMPKFRSTQGVLSDIFDPNFHCKSCDRSFSTKADFKKHCLRWHKLVVPDEEDLPDIHDPTFHCKPCGTQCEDQATFRQHCRQVHLITSFKEKGPKPFCDICQKTYINNSRYMQHRRLMHGDVAPFPPTRKPKVVNDLPPDMHDPNHYCRACDKKLACKGSFRSHLSLYHNIILPLGRNTSSSSSTSSTSSSGTPVKRYPLRKDDNKYYCRTCNHGYPTTVAYRKHLELLHSVQGAASETRAHIPSYLPDPDDPLFYCRTCGKTKPTLMHFRKHLVNIHHMSLPKLERKKKLHHVYSSDDEDGEAAAQSSRRKTSFSFYKCPVCGKRIKSKRKFAYHTKAAHKDVVAVKEDPDGPNNNVNLLSSGLHDNANNVHVETVAEDQDATAMTDSQAEQGGSSCSDSVHSNHTPEAMDEDKEESEAVVMNA